MLTGTGRPGNRSATSSTDVILEAIDPGIAVYPSDYDSQFGHLHDEVLERVAQHDIETYGTGLQGDIVLTSDGVEVEAEKEFSIDPIVLLNETPDGGETASIRSMSPGM